MLERHGYRLQGVVIVALILGTAVLASCGKKTEDKTQAKKEPAKVEESAPARETAAEPAAPAPEQATEEAAKPRVADKPPAAPSKPQGLDFTLQNLDGETVKLSQYRGKVVLLDFWATWCGPCRMSIPHLIQLHKEYEARGFTVIGVSLDQQGPAPVKAFVKSMKIPYPVVMGNRETAEAFGDIQAIPTAFLIDPRGRIVGRYEGYRDKQFFQREIEKLLPAASAS